MILSYITQTFYRTISYTILIALLSLTLNANASEAQYNQLGKTSVAIKKISIKILPTVTIQGDDTLEIIKNKKQFNHKITFKSVGNQQYKVIGSSTVMEYAYLNHNGINEEINCNSRNCELDIKVKQNHHNNERNNADIIRYTITPE